MIDPPKYPPRGYQPFEVEFKGRHGWVCATPHCDDAEALCYQVWVLSPDNTFGEHVEFLDYEGPGNEDRARVCRFFETEAHAIEGCWEHARRWWKGEPPDVGAVPYWDNRLPPGYRIFIEVEQHRMWLVKPDITTGEVSGVTLSAAMDVYCKQAWADSHERQAEKQDDGNRERVRAWVQDDEPRRWEFLRDDDGDYRPSLPQKHLVEMRIYMPHEMARDIQIIMDNCDGPRMGIQGHCKEWIEAGIREHAAEAIASMEKLEESDGV